jgi:N-methylhydantoinase A
MSTVRTVERRRARLAADIGGTFTDVVLEVGESGGVGEPGQPGEVGQPGDVGDGALPSGSGRFTAKVLTTPAAPADAVMEGIDAVLDRSGVDPGEISVVVHGTTLATNALIERRGARTALLCTEGFRDSVAMAHENRFEQYDIFMRRPDPLVPRYLRLGVPERLSAEGDVLVPLDVDAVAALVPTLVAERVESVAVAYLHSYVDPRHEQMTREVLLGELPGLAVTLSSDVCPEIREYERFSTACANAYVQPLMAAYLGDLAERLEKLGVGAPLLLMLSNGGLCTIETAIRKPVGLVESGPAGGAMLAAELARQHAGPGGHPPDLLSFDMGGTTAKLCLLVDGAPATSRELEVAREYRFLKGSGLPVRIPVIDLVEIGAGGGSIARVDGLGRIAVGPDSAGSEPGPACYGRGGQAPTVTDADVVAGRIAPERFAGGSLRLDPDAARRAIATGVAGPLADHGDHRDHGGPAADLDAAVIGIGEMVAEHMANAARVHAVERGRDLGGGTMVAFGGAAPLHACRLADRLGVDTVIVPPGAGVGSAIGFLHAPLSYEVVRSCYQRLDRFDHDAVNAVLDELRDEARRVVLDAVGDTPQDTGAIVEQVVASMRYRGQGHEIDVAVPVAGDDAGPRWFGAGDEARLLDAFDREYRSHYTRTIPGMVAEVLTWRVRVSTVAAAPRPATPVDAHDVAPTATRRVLDPEDGWTEFAEVARDDLEPGSRLAGPVLVVEDQTTTVVSPRFDVRVDAHGDLVLERRPAGE